eukprot:TRINITY_DN6484_c0_g1_i2.p1 TRINITY_DN6484_c0_g1~~TRINITY_DN6484_c0_g1_i2.p1  ORF type:complete len:423 (+),score=63.03 TRINITY_DN6484_c0_g1_i2:102-1271(+)
MAANVAPSLLDHTSIKPVIHSSSYGFPSSCRHIDNSRIQFHRIQVSRKMSSSSRLSSASLLSFIPSFSERLDRCSVLHVSCAKDPVDSSKFATSSKISLPEVSKSAESQSEQADLEEVGEDGEEESWLEEKIGTAQEYVGQAVQVVPGPRVGSTGLPWLLALPIAYMVVTFAWTVFRRVQKFNSPKGRRRRQIGKNALLNEMLDEFFPDKREALTEAELAKIQRECGFAPPEILRKYIRYALNERAFTPDVVADLIHLRKLTLMSHAEVAEILNDVASRIVKAKGVIVMNTEGMTEKGIKRKAAVGALFAKLLYLSEVEEFCSRSVHDKLRLKEEFGVTDDDADTVRIETLSQVSDVDSFERMVRRTRPERAEGEPEVVDSDAESDSEY